MMAINSTHVQRVFHEPVWRKTLIVLPTSNIGRIRRHDLHDVNGRRNAIDLDLVFRVDLCALDLFVTASDAADITHRR